MCRPDPAREWPPTSDQAAEQAEDARDKVHDQRAERRDERSHFLPPNRLVNREWIREAARRNATAPATLGDNEV